MTRIVERSGASGEGPVDLSKIEMAVAAAAVFFVPFNLLRFSFIYFTLADLLLVMALALRLHRHGLPRSFLRGGTMFWVAGLLLMTIGFMASAVVNGQVDRGFIVTLQYLFAYLVVPAVILGRPWPQTVLLVKTFCFSMFIICAYGIYLIDIDGQTNTRFVSGNGRLRSFLERENALAALIGMTVPLYLWLAAMSAIRKVTAAVGLCTLLYGSMLTGSNTGVLAFVVAIGAYILFALSFWRAIIVAAAGAVMTYLIVTVGRGYLPAVFQERVLTVVDSGSITAAGTFEYRFALILESLQFARSTFGLGLGPDQYQYNSYFQDPVHNTYLLVWTEGGLIALCGFVLTVAGAYLAVVSAMTARDGRRYVAPAVCVITTFAMLINAAPHVYARFWITPVVLAVGIAITFLEHGPPDRARGRDVAGRFLPGAADVRLVPARPGVARIGQATVPRPQGN